jgi:hypothetical protein
LRDRGEIEMKTKKEVRLPEDDENRIIEELGYEGYWRIKDVVSTVYRLTRIFPASENYHYSEKGGLFKHSVDVALAMHKEFKKREREILIVNDKGVSSMNDTAFLRRQYAIMSFLTGLLHDVGKVADYRVKIKDFEVQLNVMDLKNFLSTSDDIDLDSVTVEKLPHRKDMIHAYLSAFIMQSILGDIVKDMDAEVLTKAVEAIALEHSPAAGAAMGDNIILRLLKEGDSGSVQSFRMQSVEEKMRGYIDILKNDIVSNEHKINQDYFQIYIDRDKDYLLVNGKIAIDNMRNILKMEKHEMLGDLNRSGIIAETNNGKEIMQIKIQNGMKIPAVVVMKLHAFAFPEEFLNSLPPCPHYELLKDGKQSAFGGRDKIKEKEGELKAIQSQIEDKYSELKEMKTADYGFDEIIVDK